uniref:Uncharacterized protein n=1 Tax=Oryza punctata TaxID=4537 RepID=A0A0E0LT57_ORYPU
MSISFPVSDATTVQPFFSSMYGRNSLAFSLDEKRATLQDSGKHQWHEQFILCNCKEIAMKKHQEPTWPGVFYLLTINAKLEMPSKSISDWIWGIAGHLPRRWLSHSGLVAVLRHRPAVVLGSGVVGPPVAAAASRLLDRAWAACVAIRWRCQSRSVEFGDSEMKALLCLPVLAMATPLDTIHLLEGVAIGALVQFHFEGILRGVHETNTESSLCTA